MTRTTSDDAADVLPDPATTGASTHCPTTAIPLTDQTVHDDGSAGPSHIAVVWHPEPGVATVDIEPGDDWRECLTEEATELILDAAFLVGPWEVRFETHPGRDDSPCAECDKLYALQRASIVAVTGEPTDPRVIPTERYLPGAPPLPYRHVEPTPWTRAEGQISLRIADLVITSVVESAYEPGEDWKMPLGDAGCGAVMELVEAIGEQALQFRAANPQPDGAC